MTNLDHHITKWLHPRGEEFFAVEPVPFIEETIEFPSEFVELSELPRPSFPRVVPPTHRERPGVKDHSLIKRMLREWL